jgi:hypothetical protein
VNLSFLDKRFILMVLVGVFVFLFWKPVNVSVNQKFLLFFCVFVGVYFVLPYFLSFLSFKGVGVKEISFKDLKDRFDVFSELQYEISLNGFGWLWLQGYSMSLSSFRKKFNLARIEKEGCASYFCVYDGLKGAEKILLLPPMKYDELLRVFGAKDLLDVGNKLTLLGKSEWIASGEAMKFIGGREAEVLSKL